MKMDSTESGYDACTAQLRDDAERGVPWRTLDIPIHGVNLSKLVKKAFDVAKANQCVFTMFEDPEFEDLELRAALHDVPDEMEQLYLLVGGPPADLLAFLEDFNVMLQEPRAH